MVHHSQKFDMKHKEKCRNYTRRKPNINSVRKCCWAFTSSLCLPPLHPYPRWHLPDSEWLNTLDLGSQLCWSSDICKTSRSQISEPLVYVNLFGCVSVWILCKSRSKPLSCLARINKTMDISHTLVEHWVKGRISSLNILFRTLTSVDVNGF